MQYHHLLQKQIDSALSGAQKFDPAIVQLLKLIDQSYRNFETQQKLCEQAFQACEKQYQGILDTLQVTNNRNADGVKRLKDTITAYDPQAAMYMEDPDHVLINIISWVRKELQSREMVTR